MGKRFDGMRGGIPVLLVVGMLASPAQAQTHNETAGTQAGANLTSGDNNACYGDGACRDRTSGSNVTSIGYSAGFFNNGADNTMIGWGAGAGGEVNGDFVTTPPTATSGSQTGLDNVMVGYRAGQLNIGSDNTFVGAEAGYANTSGFDNTFIGEEAGYSTTTGNDNTFVGENAGYYNTTANDNTAVGNNALVGTSTTVMGFGNTALGSEALYDNTTGVNNTGVGHAAGSDVGVGLCNTSLGALAGTNTEHADFNTFVGFQAGWDNNRTNNTNDANGNTYVGSFAGISNREGSNNVIVGAYADFGDLDEGTAGTACTSSTSWSGTTPTIFSSDVIVDNLTAMGASIFATGDNSVTIGYAGSNSGAKAIVVGTSASSTAEESIVIGYGAVSHGANTVVFGNDSTSSWDPHLDGVTSLGTSTYRFTDVVSQSASVIAGAGTNADVVLTADNGTDNADTWALSAVNNGAFNISSFATGAYVALLSVGNAGNVTVAGDITINSDGRLKEDVEPIRGALELLENIVGVSYRWRSDTGRDATPHFGVIAQDVEATLPELVTEGQDGVLSVNYQGFTPILISAVQDLAGEWARNQSELSRLRKSVDEQNRQLALQREQIGRMQAQLARHEELLRALSER